MHPSPLQALANSLLVYNTGRSLGQFVDLMQRCGGRVAVPDVLVTAVGTKVRGRAGDWRYRMCWSLQSGPR